MTIKHIRVQTRSEEIANSLTHGIGAIAALVGTPFLILQAMQFGKPEFVAGVSVFSATAIFLYLSSSLYHALPIGKAKRVFRTIEHSAIFLLIAGTYTPLTLGVLYGNLGWALFATVWCIAFIGVWLKVFDKVTHPFVSTGLYLLMGWVIVAAIKPLLNLMQANGVTLLLAGGLAYTVGVIFYATDHKLFYGHFIWHLFVLAGTTCHYFAIFWYGV